MSIQMAESQLTAEEKAAVKRTEDTIAELRKESRDRSISVTQRSVRVRQKNLLESYLRELSQRTA